MNKYEYNMVTDKERPDFNDIGEEGWELVSVDTDGDNKTWFYFKREIETPEGVEEDIINQRIKEDPDLQENK